MKNELTLMLLASLCGIFVGLANYEVDVFAFKPGPSKSDLANDTGMAVLRQDSETIKLDTPVADEDPSDPPSDESEITDADSFLPYNNSEYGIRVDYPSDWTYTESDIDPNATIFSIVNFVPPISEDPTVSANLQIGIDELAVGQLSTLDQYARATINGYRDSYTNFSLESIQTNRTISGMPAYEVVFTDDSNGLMRKSVETGIIDDTNSRAYYLLFETENSTYDQFYPAVQNVFDSFQLYSTGSPPSPSLLSNEFGLDKTYDISMENGTNYPMRYKITNGQVTSMNLERTNIGSQSLIVDIIPEISDYEDGVLVVEIPREVLDSKDSGTNQDRNFIVYDYGSPTNWKQLSRDLQKAVIEATFANYSTEPRTIEIVGTK